MTAHVVTRLADLAPGTAQRFEIDGHSVAVVRIGDDVYAIGDTCSHGAVSLSEGEVLCDSKEIECWKHGSAFSLETGAPITLPATQPVPVYNAAVVDGDIVVTMTGDDSGHSAIEPSAIEPSAIEHSAIEQSGAAS